MCECQLQDAHTDIRTHARVCVRSDTCARAQLSLTNDGDAHTYTHVGLIITQTRVGASRPP